MFRLACVSIAIASFVGAGRLSADDADKTKELVDKILKANGGEEKLAKIKGQVYKAKGTINAKNGLAPYSVEFKQLFPNKCHYELTLKNDDGESMKIETSVNDKEGWNKNDGGVMEMEEDGYKIIQAAINKNWIVSALPLKDSSVKVTGLGKSKIGDKEVDGLKVSVKDRPDVSIYFDATTHMLVKSSYMAKPPMSDEEVETIQEFSNHKDVDGVKVAMKNKVTRGGNPYQEYEFEEVKFVDKLDDSTFAKPKDS